MGTPEFALPTLETLAKGAGFSVEAVFTQPDRPKGRGRRLTPPPVKIMAESFKIPLFQPVRASNKDSGAILKEIAPEYLVVVAYGQLLSKEVLEIPSRAPVNLHASLLPRWRGAAPIHRAILAGDKVTGVCSMLMEETLDTGDVLMSTRTDITEEDTFLTLHDRLARIGGAIMEQTLKAYHHLGIEPLQQNEHETTYAPKVAPGDLLINWTLPAKIVSRRIRGMSPFPGAFTLHSGKKIKLLMAKVIEEFTGDPGVILDIGKKGITVSCGDGAVLITELKPPGKGAMSAHAYSLGHQVKPGDRFCE